MRSARTGVEKWAQPTLARRMTLTSSPIQMTNMNFSRNECSSLLYLILT